MININLLPKNLRRRREPGYWRLIAVLFPLLVIGVVGFITFSTLQTTASLEADRDLKQTNLDRLKPFLDEQTALQERQRALNELIAIDNAIQEGRIGWSGELGSMLETVPPQGDSEQPRIAISSMTMTALDEGTQQNLISNSRYDGLRAVAEFQMVGRSINSQALADYVRNLEDSPLFGVFFQNADLDPERGTYEFTMTVGAFDREGDEESEEVQ